MDYIIHLLITICLYIVISSSLNLLSGYLGAISIAQAAFVGIGAYITAILAVTLGINPILAFSISIILSVLFAVLLGIPFFYTYGKDFVLITFAFQILFNNVTNNLKNLTGGAIGISNIPHIETGISFLSYKIEFLFLCLPFVTGMFVFMLFLSKSVYGRLLKAIREDYILVTSFGQNVRRVQKNVFILTVIMTSVIGSLYAMYYSHIDPTSFSFDESVFLLSLIIIGGAGSIWGSVISSIVLILLPELLGLLGISSAIAANARQIIYCVALIIIMLVKPKGILGDYSFKHKNVEETSC